MTFSLDIRPDIRDVTRYLDSVQRKQVPFATALALTRTAQSVQAEQKSTMRRVFNAPTRGTINSVRVKPATKRRLESSVWIRDEATKGTPPIKYLAPQIHGGTRREKRFERALRAAGILPRGMFVVPGKDAKLNANGNITAGTYTRILSQLRASPDPVQNATDSKRSRRSRRSGKYFVMRRRGSRRGVPTLPLGIYERKGKQLKSILHFVRTTPRYTVRYRFDDVAQRTAAKAFRPHFNEAMRRALRTAR